MNVRLLKSKMALVGVTQRNIAELLNKTDASISAKFSGKSPLYIDEAEKICEILKITSPHEMGAIFLQTPSQNGDNFVADATNIKEVSA